PRMKTSSWRRWWQSQLRIAQSKIRHPKSWRPSLESLEDRTLPSGMPHMVLDLNSTTLTSDPHDIVAIGSTAYFAPSDGIQGTELWKSDGTAAGTVLVADINPGSAGSSLGYLTNVNGTLFFAADDGTHGVELWKSDSAAAGTVLVKDI